MFNIPMNTFQLVAYKNDQQVFCSAPTRAATHEHLLEQIAGLTFDSDAQPVYQANRQGTSPIFSDINQDVTFTKQAPTNGLSWMAVHNGSMYAIFIHRLENLTASRAPQR
jgi:hypothetical protein